MSDAQKNMAEARQKRNEILQRGKMTQADFEREFLAQGFTPAMARFKAERSAILAPTESKTRAKLITDYLSETKGEIPQDLWLKDRQAAGIVKKQEEAMGRKARQNEMEQKAREAEKARIEEGIRRAENDPFAKIVGGLTKVGDFLVDTAGTLAPVTSEVQKTFAPPDSKQYKKGSVEEKARAKIEEKVGSALKG